MSMSIAPLASLGLVPDATLFAPVLFTTAVLLAAMPAVISIADSFVTFAYQILVKVPDIA